SLNAVAEHGGQVYAATDVGLFRQAPGRLGRPGADGPAYARFDPVPGVPAFRGQVWDTLPTRTGLLVAAHDGVFVVDGRAGRKIWSGLAFSLAAVSRRPDRVLVGTKDGVVRLALRGGQWAADGAIDGIVGETRFMQEDAEGAMWISQPGGNLYRMPRPEDDRPTLQTFGVADGLSVSPGPLNLIDGRLHLVTREGVFHVERAGRRVRLSRDPEFAGLAGTFALYTPDGRTAWTYADGVLASDGADGFRLGGVQPTDLLVQRSGVVWVATADGLLRYDPRVRTGARTYPATIRRVTDRQRRVFFGGARGRPPTDGVDLVLPIYDARGLRVEFSAALFDRPERAEFSTRLLGSDDESWGPWAPERVAAFTGLREGTYTFEVRARDDQGHRSTVAGFSVRVLPPWYRTWWAYTLYALALAGFVWGVTAWRVHTQRVKLDAARARNARMQRLGARLQETNTRLRKADKLKDDLLSNTSHELRTPLTAILGFSEMLLDEATDDQRDLAEGIQRGGQRLLETVNGLLDMFKLQSGTMEVFPEEVDAAALVRDNARLLAPLAAQ
ncbi:MAG TPA: histidine kinase dimerization/phospho-acceptor domain-containing protein, partial [Rubricoccaceae bacterium]